jgi:hypothetical protein
MVCMKMLSLAVLARAKGVSPPGEKHSRGHARCVKALERYNQRS